MISGAAQERGARRLVEACACLAPGEAALVLSDPATRDLGELVASAARAAGGEVEHLTIPPLTAHGAEPPAPAAQAMASAAVVFCLTARSLALSQARQEASRGGTRFLSLPAYTPELLAGQALTADFQALTAQAHRLAEALTRASGATLITPDGELAMDLGGRSGNASPGWCEGPGSLASPPDAECNIAPREESARGRVTLDGSVACPEMGVLAAPLRLTFGHGRLEEITGPGAERLGAILDAAGPRARVLGELGIGLNPLARHTGAMLEDEGVRGSVHLGLGANAGLGGANRVPFHLDLTISRPRLLLDGRPVVDAGEILV